MKCHLRRLLAVSAAVLLLLSLTALPWDQSPTQSGIGTAIADGGGSGPVARARAAARKAGAPGRAAVRKVEARGRAAARKAGVRGKAAVQARQAASRRAGAPGKGGGLRGRAVEAPDSSSGSSERWPLGAEAVSVGELRPGSDRANRTPPAPSSADTDPEGAPSRGGPDSSAIGAGPSGHGGGTGQAASTASSGPGRGSSTAAAAEDLTHPDRVLAGVPVPAAPTRVPRRRLQPTPPGMPRARPTRPPSKRVGRRRALPRPTWRRRRRWRRTLPTRPRAPPGRRRGGPGTPGQRPAARAPRRALLRRRLPGGPQILAQLAREAAEEAADQPGTIRCTSTLVAGARGPARRCSAAPPRLAGAGAGQGALGELPAGIRSQALFRQGRVSSARRVTTRPRAPAPGRRGPRRDPRQARALLGWPTTTSRAPCRPSPSRPGSGDSPPGTASTTAWVEPSRLRATTSRSRRSSRARPLARPRRRADRPRHRAVRAGALRGGGAAARARAPRHDDHRRW